MTETTINYTEPLTYEHLAKLIGIDKKTIEKVKKEQFKEKTQ